MARWLLGVVLLGGLSSLPVAGQIVVVVRGVPLTSFGSIDAADFDGDGDHDLMLIGQDLDGNPVTGLYRFEGRLVEPIPRQAPRIVANHSSIAFTSRRMKDGKVSWMDVDGDGDPDLLISGRGVNEVGIDDIQEQPATDLYENQDGQALIVRSGTGLKPVFEPDLDWADIDGDGTLDLALSGVLEDTTPFLAIYRQESPFVFSAVVGPLNSVSVSDLEFGDFDGDGDPDLLVVGSTASGTVSTLYENEAGQFSEAALDLPDLLLAQIAVTDFNGDGLDDLYFTGGELGPDLLVGSGVLLRSTSTDFVLEQTLPGVVSGNVSFGDYDADGDADLLVAGVTDLESTDHQSIYVLERDNGTFVERHTFQGVLFGPTIWYDYNGDGRLDILTAGIQENALIMSIFEL